MKPIQLKQLSGIILVVVVAVTVLFSFSSCAKKVNFQSSTVVPAARGDVKIKKDNNKNYNIQISLNNLSEPNRLQPAKNTYVVWMESADNVTKNIGQINSSTGFLSNKLKASFETVSSIKPTKIYLTAEDDPGVQYPGSMVVLTTGNF